MNFKKKLATTLVIVPLAFNAFISTGFAGFTNIYEESYEENISSGAVHEKILRFTDKGWLNLNVLRINLEDQYTSLDVLTSSEGLSGRSPLSRMISNYTSGGSVVGAVNADFFDTKTFATIGPVVRNSDLVTTSIFDPKFATFNINNNDDAFIDYWALTKITLENENNNYDLAVSFVNKPYIENNPVLLNNSWGKMSIGNRKYPDIVEMVVSDGKVIEIRENLEATEIPSNGFVISTSGATKSNLLNNFSIGDKVNIDIKNDPNIENLKLAVGGGAVILKDGHIPSDFSVKIPGSHPRTAIGITKDKKEVILLTVDGRSSSYPGVTQTELAEFLLELGASDGLNLDGGGSTEMVVRGAGEESISIANEPSDGFERSIVNGLGVVSSAPKSSYKGIKIDSDREDVFVNTSISLDVKAYDEYYNPFEINNSQIMWSVEGVDGEFANNKFIPRTSGKGKITAYYLGEKATYDINVLDDLVTFEISPAEIYMDTSSEKEVSIYGINSEGYKAKIEPENINWSIPSYLGRFSDGKFISTDRSFNGALKGSLSGFDFYIPVAIGYDKDVINRFEDLNGQFISYPTEVTGYYELTSNSRYGERAGKLSYDFSTTSAARAAYIAFDNGGITLEKKPEKIGMWVYGNGGNDHWLRGVLMDSKGASYKIDFARNVNWKDWKFVEASIPADLVPPLKLERVYLVETEANYKDAGSIIIDDITAFYAKGLPGDAPKHNTNVSDVRNVVADTKGTNSFKFLVHGNSDNMNTLLENNDLDNLPNLNEITGNNLSDTAIKKYKNSTFINLNNTNATLRKTYFNQWEWLLDKVNTINTSNLFITMPNTLEFNDKLEEKLFFDTLQKLKDSKDVDIWILTGGTYSDYNIKVKNGIRIVPLEIYKNYINMGALSSFRTLVFTVNDGYVTYEVKELR